MLHPPRLAIRTAAFAAFAVVAVPARAQNTAAPASAPAPATWTFKHTPAAVMKDLGAFLYPKNNQSAEQQNKDTTECLLFANDQTGIDLDTFKKTGQSAEEKQAAKAPKGGAVKGAARGAAAGAIVGGIAGDAGTGAGVGAAGGAIAGRRAQKKGEQQAAQAQKDAEAKALADAKETVKKPLFACLDAKGYSAK